MKYISSTKIGRSVVNAVNGSLTINTKSTYRAFVSFDPPWENFAPSDENGLVEYAIDNDMIKYQRRVYNNGKILNYRSLISRWKFLKDYDLWHYRYPVGSFF
jgi:hypothetical protein